MSINYLYLAIIVLGLSTGCKNSKKPSSNPAPTSADTAIQQQGLNDTPDPTVSARITLNGQDSSQTISVKSLDFDSLGGLPVVIENFTSTSLAIGILSGPSGVRLESSSGQHSLKGAIPSGATGTSTIVILARDLTKCGTTADCNITPDGSGRFDQQQVQQNSTADLVGQFNIMLDTTIANDPNTTNNPTTNTNNSGGGTGSGVRGFFSSVSNGAKSAWNYLRGLFN